MFDMHGTCIISLFPRPLIQGKLDVLSKAGLSKDDFSDAGTKRLEVL